MLLNYHDLLVTGIVGAGLAVYILFMIAWCVYQRLPQHHQEIPDQRLNSSLGGEKSFASMSLNRCRVSAFKYKKGINSSGEQEEEEEEEEEAAAEDEEATDDAGCAICLLGFEDGEDVEQLPRCNHSFHAPCIDMWLYSHSDCPLCRQPLEEVASEGNDF